MSHCEKVDGMKIPDKETDGYVFNHIMLRIKDPIKSLDFYSKIMGMRMVKKIDFPSMKFSLYFLGNWVIFPSPGNLHLAQEISPNFPRNISISIVKTTFCLHHSYHHISDTGI